MKSTSLNMPLVLEGAYPSLLLFAEGRHLFDSVAAVSSGPEP